MSLRSAVSSAFVLPVLIVLVAIGTLPPLPVAVRLPMAVILTAVLPGLALELALGPMRARDRVIRGATVVATSISLSILIGLVVDVVPGAGVTQSVRVLSVGVASLMLCGVGLLRGGAWPWQAPATRRLRLSRPVATSVLVLGGLVTVASVVAVGAAHRQENDSDITSLWITGAPTGGCTVGVTQRHGAAGHYRLLVRNDNTTIRVIGLESTGRLDYRLFVDGPGMSSGRIEARLFDSPGGRRPLRRASIAVSECRSD